MTTPPIDLPEAPASLNFRGVTAKGWDVQFTLRDWSEEALLTRFGAFVKQLEAVNITPPEKYTVYHANPDKSNAPSLGSATANDLSSTVETRLPVAGSSAPQKAEELSFDAETLVGSMNEGKRYWKVKGGRFSKFGVTIWPEAARESGIDLDAADISQPYTLKNMVAHYVLNEKGQPEKVTRLVYK